MTAISIQEILKEILDRYDTESSVRFVEDGSLLTDAIIAT